MREYQIESLSSPSVIIVGSGRCGTSTLGKLCHEQLGICMGHSLKMGDKVNPEGYYEDLVSHAMVRAMANHKDPGPYTPIVYLQVMNHQHRDCLAWGVKDPWFLYLPIQVLQRLTPKLCIVALRDVEATITSWYKMFKASYPGAEITPQITAHYKQLTETRQEMCNEIIKIWPNTIYIDFTERIEEDELAKMIRNGLAMAQPNRRQE